MLQEYEEQALTQVYQGCTIWDRYIYKRCAENMITILETGDLTYDDIDETQTECIAEG